MKNRPIFSISLDFELHWGRFDKVALPDWENYYLRTRMAIPKILQLFDTFGVEATWATVGMLFANSLKEWLEYAPISKPSYKDNVFSPYHWLLDNPLAAETCLFAPDLIQQILHTPGQELGSHTFSHYYTLAKGQTEGQFRDDLIAAQRIASEKFGVQLTSLVFPRNQFNRRYLHISKEIGFTAVRSNPKDWFWKDTSRETLLKRIFRTADVYLPVGMPSSYPLSGLDWQQDVPLEIPASRFLRPYSGNGAINRIKARRIKNEMTKAASNAEIYHLWWHPHNHGERPEESLAFLRTILEHFAQLRIQYGMLSCNMASVEKLARSKSLDPDY